MQTQAVVLSDAEFYDCVYSDLESPVTRLREGKFVQMYIHILVYVHLYKCVMHGKNDFIFQFPLL